MDLDRIMRVVADIDVAWVAPPRHEMSDDFGIGSRVEQGVNVNFANISRAEIAVTLGAETVCGAGVVGSLSRERSVRNDGQITRPGGYDGKRSRDCQKHFSHLPSPRQTGAELHKRLLREPLCPVLHTEVPWPIRNANRSGPVWLEVRTPNANCGCTVLPSLYCCFAEARSTENWERRCQS